MECPVCQNESANNSELCPDHKKEFEFFLLNENTRPGFAGDILDEWIDDKLEVLFG